MPYHVAYIPIRGDAEAEHSLNGFLQSHRILAVDRRLVGQGENACWAFCVEYLVRGSGGSTTSAEGSRTTGNRNRVDYRDVLKPEEFAVFSRLRDLRKQLANAEGVPVYAVFTNEQLAQMVQQQVTTSVGLEKIMGVGDARVAKYGSPFLECLTANQLNRAGEPEGVSPRTI